VFHGGATYTLDMETFDTPYGIVYMRILQAIRLLFKENRFARGEFAGLGQRLSLKSVTCPAYLFAGKADDIATKEQVFAAEHRWGTPGTNIRKSLVPGGHIGLCMRARTLKEAWPRISRWIGEVQADKEGSI
jgi:poly(3-hydroxybutyrate) depolymerase